MCPNPEYCDDIDMAVVTLTIVTIVVCAIRTLTIAIGYWWSLWKVECRMSHHVDRHKVLEHKNAQLKKEASDKKSSTSTNTQRDRARNARRSTSAPPSRPN